MRVCQANFINEIKQLPNNMTTAKQNSKTLNKTNQPFEQEIIKILESITEKGLK